METKANYVAVGVFTLITIALCFAFVFWVGRYDERGEYVDLDILIEGSVTGLAKGSPVLFNGIQVGSVRKLTIATNAPKFVNARVRIDSQTPIRKDTSATIGIQGLTGGAYVQLEGGSRNSPGILDMADADTGKVPRIEAAPAALNDIISRVNKIAARTEVVMAQVEEFLGENRASLSTTIKNAEKFSDALAQNADGVEQFMAGIASVSASMEGLSAKLDGTIKGAEEIIKAVDPESVRNTVANVEEFTKTLKSTRSDITRVVDSISKAAADIDRFSQGLNETLGKVDTLVASVDSAKVTTAVDDISTMVANAKKVVATIESNNIDKTLGDIGEVAANANKVLAVVEPQKITRLIDDLGKTIDDASSVVAAVDTARVANVVEQAEKAARSASVITDDIKTITGKIRNRGDDVNQIIVDTRELANRLSKASERVDGVLAKLDGMLGGGNGDSLVAETRATLADFRKLADNLNLRVNEVSTGLTRFTTRGLGEAEVMIRDARRSINRIEGAISNFESNPQRFITGTPGVRQVSGGRPRR